ncbi:hypothetical protein FACS189430_03920 [Bacteroidia bacterium]|nr:hypothetical protein FACS189430_03920 [Bacteroidia bacterium]
MDTSNFPRSIYEFYWTNSSMFEERVDKQKRLISYVLTAICVLLIIVPSIIPIGNWLVRIVAVIGLIGFGYSAFFGSKDYYSLASGGKIKKLATKKFAYPEDNATLDCAACQKVINMFRNDDFAGLAAEPASNDRPLQLDIHEDATGKTFYLLLTWYFSTSDKRGITDVKVIQEPQYSQFCSNIKNIKST